MINPEQAAADSDQATALACVMQTHHGPITLSRSRYAEDQLAAALDQGVQQYVILGAGFDTFAFRRPDLLDRLQVFEIDHPATQALKHQRLAMLGKATRRSCTLSQSILRPGACPTCSKGRPTIRAK